MAKRTAIKLTRWSLLLTALVLVFGLGWLFWTDVREGREARETMRVQGAQERVQEAAPTPAAPLQAPPQ